MIYLFISANQPCTTALGNFLPNVVSVRLPPRGFPPLPLPPPPQDVGEVRAGAAVTGQ